MAYVRCALTCRASAIMSPRFAANTRPATCKLDLALSRHDKLKFIGHLLLHIRHANHRLMKHCDLRRIAHVTSGHRNRLGEIVRSFPAKHCRHVRILSPCSDYFAYMLSSILAPVPHEEWMSAVICIAPPVHLDIARIISKLSFIFVTEHIGVACFRKQPIKELNVTRRKTMIEVVVAREMEDQHATLLQQRLVSM